MIQSKPLALRLMHEDRLSAGRLSARYLELMRDLQVAYEQGSIDVEHYEHDAARVRAQFDAEMALIGKPDRAWSRSAAVDDNSPYDPPLSTRAIVCVGILAAALWGLLIGLAMVDIGVLLLALSALAVPLCVAVLLRWAGPRP